MTRLEVDNNDLFPEKHFRPIVVVDWGNILGADQADVSQFRYPKSLVI